jgi:hypothetical protein
VNEEKNAARERSIQNNTKNAYKLAQTKERRLFRKKARQLDEEASIEIERHRSSQDSCKFYNRLNHQVLARRKEHIEEHLNKGSESEQPTRPVDLRDDRVDIEEALKYLKNNKAAGAHSIAAELLNHGGPNLVDVLHEVIHRGYCVQCKKG